MLTLSLVTQCLSLPAWLSMLEDSTLKLPVNEDKKREKLLDTPPNSLQPNPVKTNQPFHIESTSINHAEPQLSSSLIFG